ncbi:hypothetical protein WA158_004947 [Blastocystis sp. Blastoise]
MSKGKPSKSSGRSKARSSISWIFLALVFIIVITFLCYAGQAWTKQSETQNNSGTLTMSSHVPHDGTLYTQGIFFYDQNTYYESGGLYGQSRIQKVSFPDGIVLKQYTFPKEIFGEGITLVNNTIYMFTWKEHKGYKFDLDLNLLEEFTFSTRTGEGWGMTYDGISIVVSDGSNSIMFWDPNTLKETKRISVHYQSGKTVGYLNELEYINGYIYANVYYQEIIVKINPLDGQVEQILDLSSLRPLLGDNSGYSAEVLNGIAYDGVNDTIWITGKRWSKMFGMKYQI